MQSSCDSAAPEPTPHNPTVQTPLTHEKKSCLNHFSIAFTTSSSTDVVAAPGCSCLLSSTSSRAAARQLSSGIKLRARAMSCRSSTDCAFNWFCWMMPSTSRCLSVSCCCCCASSAYRVHMHAGQTGCQDEGWQRCSIAGEAHGYQHIIPGGSVQAAHPWLRCVEVMRDVLLLLRRWGKGVAACAACMCSA